MQTEIKDVKTAAFDSKEHYLKFRAQWKRAINGGFQPTATHMVVYNQLRNKDIYDYFSPIKAENKIVSNGNMRYYAIWVATNNLYRIVQWGDELSSFIKRKAKLLEPFADTVSAEMIEIVLKELESCRDSYTYKHN